MARATTKTRTPSNCLSTGKENLADKDTENFEGASLPEVIIKKVEKKSKKQRKKRISNEGGGDNVLKEEINECEINGALKDKTDDEKDATRSVTEVKKEKPKKEKVEDAIADFDDAGFQVVMNRKTEKKVKQGNKFKGFETRNIESRSPDKAIKQVSRVRDLGVSESEFSPPEKEAKEAEFVAAPPPRNNPWKVKAETIENTGTVQEVKKEIKSPTIEESLIPAKQMEAYEELQLKVEPVEEVEGETVAVEVKEEAGKFDLEKDVTKVEVVVKEVKVEDCAVGTKEEAKADTEESEVEVACCWPRLGETEAAGGGGDKGGQDSSATCSSSICSSAHSSSATSTSASKRRGCKGAPLVVSPNTSKVGKTEVKGAASLGLQKIAKVATSKEEKVTATTTKDEKASKTKEATCCPGKMFVGGLSWQTSSGGLAEHFSAFGEVAEAVVMVDPHTQRSRGFGFVTFAVEEAVAAVLEVAVHRVDGKVVEPKQALARRQLERPRRGERRDARHGGAWEAGAAARDATTITADATVCTMDPLTCDLAAPSTAGLAGRPGDWRPVWTPRHDMAPFVPQECAAFVPQEATAFVTPVLVEPSFHLPGHLGDYHHHHGPGPSEYVYHMDNNNMAMEDVSMAVRQQVEYLLSPAVLQHDIFLRTSMTEDGWLPLQLVAATDWVAALTSDPSVVAASLQDSTLVEVKGLMARPWERPHLWPILSAAMDTTMDTMALDMDFTMDSTMESTINTTAMVLNPEVAEFVPGGLVQAQA